MKYKIICAIVLVITFTLVFVTSYVDPPRAERIKYLYLTGFNQVLMLIIEIVKIKKKL
jgi:hypothetical protein